MPNPCEKDAEIATLSQGQRHMLELIREVSVDIKAMRKIMDEVSSLTLKHEFQQCEITRVSKRLDEMMISHKEFDAFINEASGMKKLAWAAWGLLSGGLGIVLLKVFKVIGT